MPATKVPKLKRLGFGDVVRPFDLRALFRPTLPDKCQKVLIYRQLSERGRRKSIVLKVKGGRDKLKFQENKVGVRERGREGGQRT